MADYKGTSGNDSIDQAKLAIPNGTHIYGEEGDDTIIVTNATVFGGAGNNTLTNLAKDGVSTLAYWYGTQGINANLATGIIKNSFGGTDTVSGFHHIMGSGRDDVIAGDSNDNVFMGLSGSDRFTGGGGFDTVKYFNVRSTDAKISYDKATDTFTIVKTFSNGDKGTDTLTGIDLVIFDGAGSDYKVFTPLDFITPVSYSFAGAVTGLAAGVAVAGPFYEPITLSGRTGLVIGGWGYQGEFGGSKPVATIPAVILEQQADGAMKVATSKYMANASTQGVGSVIVGDFNTDGRPDIFMPAHNESPFIAVASAAWIQNASGTFDRIPMNDAIMAHDGQAFNINGKLTVFTQVFTPGDYNPWYIYADGKFVMTEQAGGAKLTSNGASIAVADFDGNGSYEVIMGDMTFGPGYPMSQDYKWQLVLYKLDDILNNTGAPIRTMPTWFMGKPEYANVVSLGGAGVAHTPRIKLDDFNHDGLVDFIAVQGMWARDNPNYPALLQMGQNLGQLMFADRTDVLNPGYNINTNEADYSLQLLDIDGSGIDSVISGASGKVTDGVSRAANYVLLNDGTGRLHVALHDEFIGLSQGVLNFLYGSAEARALGVEGFAGRLSYESKFMPYVASDGTLNFVAWKDGVMVNVPLRYNPATDYAKSIAIDDRNDSKLMRTFAGNDTIRDANSNGATRIDGGAGTDTAIYSGAMSAYAIKRAVDGTLTVSAGAGVAEQVADTLVRVERLDFKDLTLHFANGKAADFTVSKSGATYSLSRAGTSESLAGVERVLFSDSALAFDTSGNAGKAYRVYQAAFDRVPDMGGLGFWISAMDKGLSLATIAGAFIDSAEFKLLYGSNPSNADLVGKFYRNVLHREPEQQGFDFWKSVLDNKLATPADVLAAFSESAENVAGVAAIIGNGISYTLFS